MLAGSRSAPTRYQAVFLAGYAVVWAAFALVAFLGDTQIHWLVHHWFWLDTHAWVIGATTFAIAGSVPVQPAQGALPQAVPQPVQLLRALLSQRGRSSLAPGPAPRRVLPGLLLGADAGHVWHRRGQLALDGSADWGDGH